MKLSEVKREISDEAPIIKETMFTRKDRECL